MRPSLFPFALFPLLSFFVLGFWLGRLVIEFVGYASGLVLLFSVVK